MINDVRLLIDGKFIKSDAKEKLSVINPADQKVLARVPMCSKNDIKPGRCRRPKSPRKLAQTYRYPKECG